MPGPILGMGSAALKEAETLPSVSSWPSGGTAKLIATIQGDEWEKPSKERRLANLSLKGLRSEGKAGRASWKW